MSEGGDRKYVLGRRHRMSTLPRAVPRWQVPGLSPRKNLAEQPSKGDHVPTIRSDPRSNERVRDLVLEKMRDGGWYPASEIAGDSAWPDIVAVEWELKLLRDQGAAESDAARGWRVMPNLEIGGGRQP